MTFCNTLLCVVGALISTVCCENCTTCLGRNRKDCEGVTIDCKELGCITVSESCVVENIEYPTLYKGCAVEGLGTTDVLFSLINDAGIKLLINSKYCKSENCNQNTTYQVPNNSGRPNGLLCESCFRNNTDEECSSRDVVRCRGKETACLTYVGTVERADLSVVRYALKGCVYKPGCALGFKASPGIREISQKTYACRDATTSDNYCRKRHK
ncbi:phospholipase A2 inhibitor and Ly6/PLAUR domain-containing protein-like [Ascaphus truei]|uniref:phospholipase A2 inhibitor and Ly6/PLAUR domain-containing protein-like n=1 Tax=Ascaphus truei TaxID=8439 RepID=UPI003F5AAD49